MVILEQQRCRCFRNYQGKVHKSVKSTIISLESEGKIVDNVTKI